MSAAMPVTIEPVYPWDGVPKMGSVTVGSSDTGAKRLGLSGINVQFAEVIVINTSTTDTALITTDSGATPGAPEGFPLAPGAALPLHDIFVGQVYVVWYSGSTGSAKVAWIASGRVE